ncbi:MAG TPA: hypothetical protein VGS97_06345 [Actinocrinis sp.]|uniref:hypothetical protein n=1 Tax=Actinocrinis sp. TaxID=1920516 RepID=UPI002DDCA2D1|nr:hypothetical protein [Actinocrinis sp.]HEV2343691.1 hypothetical protein [Actinocrinis sp.]
MSAEDESAPAAEPTAVEAAQGAVMEAFFAIAADADSEEAALNADRALLALDELLG